MWNAKEAEQFWMGVVQKKNEKIAMYEEALSAINRIKMSEELREEVKEVLQPIWDKKSEKHRETL